MKKKILALVLIVALVASLAVALVACDNTDKDNNTVVSFKPIAKENIKFGLIALHDENSTYDKNFIDAANNAAKKLGVQISIKRNIPEDNACYEAAVDLVNEGCNIIFADSFGHEDYVLKAAQEFPNVRFAHATGTKAHTELLPNFYNAFASIYEGRYLAGVAAGMKLKEMYPDATSLKMGYVGAFPYAEVVSGYTSFYLGAKSVMNEGVTLTMDVKYTGSWYDPVAEKSAAEALIKGGAQLISQHADSMGAPTACAEYSQKNGVLIPNVTYNISTKEDIVVDGVTYKSTYLIGSKVNWEPYFEYLINCVINGVTAVGFDYVGTLATDSVQVLEFGNDVSDEIKNAVAAAQEELLNGTRKVFDLSTFTKADGSTITSYIADVDTDEKFEGDTQVVLNGVFLESVYRSAPYFDIRIAGITELN